jgi:putative ABC transport system ATP-binding protein
VMDLLTGVTRHSGAALVVVTHNPSVAAWCPRIVTMWDGRIRHDSATSTTTPASAAASSLGAA